MKRRTKLLLLLTSLLTLGVVGAVLTKIQQNAGVPIPGAVVVLDDASWRSRSLQDEYDNGYAWTTPNAVLYQQKQADEYPLIRRDIGEGKASPPQFVSYPVPPQRKLSLSPDGKILCIAHNPIDDVWKTTLVPLEEKSKPVTVPVRGFWSADSHLFMGTKETPNGFVMVQCDLTTGRISQKMFDELYANGLHMTPKGRLLSFSYDVSYHGEKVAWEVRDWQTDTCVVKKSYAFQNSEVFSGIALSPTGERILWKTTTFYEPSVNKLRQWIFHVPREIKVLTRWEVSDLSGNNRQPIGSITKDLEELSKPTYNELEPQWTPDGKGVHFVQEGKLMYLAVP